MKSSFNSLIPFLPLFCNCQFRRLDSIQFLCSHAHISAGWRLETRNSTLFNWTFLYNSFARTTQKTQPLYFWEGVFTALLHKNGSYSIVACVFVAAGMCLPSRCLAMNVYSDFTFRLSGVMSQCFMGRSQRLCGARHLIFSATWTMGSWVRNHSKYRFIN
jgi:hypothetical protein